MDGGEEEERGEDDGDGGACHHLLLHCCFCCEVREKKKNIMFCRTALGLRVLLYSESSNDLILFLLFIYLFKRKPKEAGVEDDE